MSFHQTKIHIKFLNLLVKSVAKSFPHKINRLPNQTVMVLLVQISNQISPIIPLATRQIPNLTQPLLV
jgi:hypothetical protein